MKDLSEFRADIEESFTWRQEEYRIIKNTIKEDNKIPITKMLIAILYAHYEGFFKDAFEIYINFINSTGLELNKFNNSLITASLDREYSSFEDLNRLCRELTTDPPKENYLNRFHRRFELTKIFSSRYLNKIIKIDDKIIDTKSNLTYVVLQENLYVLGLEYDLFSEKKDKINKLVHLRNSIAHGSQKELIEFNDLEMLETEILGIINTFITYLYKFCEDKEYLTGSQIKQAKSLVQ